MKKIVEHIDKICKHYSKTIKCLKEKQENLLNTDNNNMQYFHNLEKTAKVHCKTIHEFGEYCEEYKAPYGSVHPEYGGTLVDLRGLVAGISVWVTNGGYHAWICLNEKGQKGVAVNDKFHVLTEKQHSAYILLESEEDE